MRTDREDTRAQEEAVTAARADLERTLTALADEASAAAKAARSKRGQPDLDAVAACHNAVQRAGEALDMAVYDLNTARGADG